MRLNNKIVNWLSCGLAVVVLAFGLGCGGSSGGGSDNGGGGGDNGAVAYQYWKSNDNASYIMFNIYGDEARRVTGKPFLILTYDKISLEITNCEFGLSAVTQEAIANQNDFPAFPEPTLDATTVDPDNKLSLQNPVDLCVSWGSEYDTSRGPITNGVQNFSFFHHLNSGTYAEKWRFTYTSDNMTGDVTNLDINDFTGRQSGPNAFVLHKL